MAAPVAAGPEADAAAATTGASVLSGGLWKGASLTLPQLYALFQSIVAARFLGPHGMGVQSFIAFTQISVITMASVGLSTTLMRFIGEILGRGRPGELRDLVAWGWRIQGAGAVVAGAVVAIGVVVGASPRSAWALAAVAATASVLHTVPSAILIGAQRWRDASVVGLVTGAVATGAIAAVLAAGGGITGMFAVEAAVAFVNLAWTGALGRRALRRLAPAPRVPAVSLRRAARNYALLASITSLVTLVVWRRSELFFLKHYSPSEEVAFYSIAFSVMTALVALPQSLSQVVSPAVATLFGAGAGERIRSGFSRGARLLVLVSLPATAGALALGPETLRVIWGNDYRATGTVFLLLLIPLPLLPAINLARAFLTGIGVIGVPLLITVAAGGANVALDFLLIPRHDAVGAAIANSAAQLAAGVPIFVYTIRRVGGVRWEAPALARTAVASAVAGALAWGSVHLVGGAGGLAVGLVLGTGLFVLLGALLRILPADDAAWLDEAAGGRLRGLIGRTVRLWASAPAPGA